jgi:hypothetical protein
MKFTPVAVPEIVGSDGAIKRYLSRGDITKVEQIGDMDMLEVMKYYIIEITNDLNSVLARNASLPKKKVV